MAAASPEADMILIVPRIRDYHDEVLAMNETVSLRKGMFFFSEVLVVFRFYLVKVAVCSAICKSAVVPSKDVAILEFVLRSNA